MIRILKSQIASKGDSQMLVGVVGGKLQGVEAAYLARKAGWKVRIVDKKPRVPASELCDSFVQVDVTVENNLDRALGDVDFIIPALEDDKALGSLRSKTTFRRRSRKRGSISWTSSRGCSNGIRYWWMYAAKDF
jgi:hypothetical protein